MATEDDDIAIFWFRRDLRLDDNSGLWHALRSGYRVVPVFIYDTRILNRLEPDDIRMGFLSKTLEELNESLRREGSSLITISGTPEEAFRRLNDTYKIKALFFNRDYEPYGINRDNNIKKYFQSLGIPCYSFRDHVIFEMSDVVKDDGKPYTVYTPYSKKWLSVFDKVMVSPFPSESLKKYFAKLYHQPFITPGNLGFSCPVIRVKYPVLDPVHIKEYDSKRDIPSEEGTSLLGPHLRFGTISIREVLRRTLGISSVFLRELIWREFFMQILFHFPHVEGSSFRPEYDRIGWINNEDFFHSWCEGMTGFPFIDAGMRELKETGYMHNRVRMVAANFLTRHLLTDWRWGEAWFAQKLLDFELSSNNGNWQWASGSGCDAAPYFRVFNPEIQVNKFDPEYKYIRRWIPEFGTPDYPQPVVDHSAARERAVKYYKEMIRGL